MTSGYQCERIRENMDNVWILLFLIASLITVSTVVMMNYLIVGIEIEPMSYENRNVDIDDNADNTTIEIKTDDTYVQLYSNGSLVNQVNSTGTVDEDFCKLVIITPSREIEITSF